MAGCIGVLEGLCSSADSGKRQPEHYRFAVQCNDPQRSVSIDDWDHLRRKTEQE